MRNLSGVDRPGLKKVQRNKEKHKKKIKLFFFFFFFFFVFWSIKAGISQVQVVDVNMLSFCEINLNSSHSNQEQLPLSSLSVIHFYLKLLNRSLFTSVPKKLPQIGFKNFNYLWFESKGRYAINFPQISEVTTSQPLTQ